MAELIAQGHFAVGEFNDDLVWGFGLFVLPFLQGLPHQQEDLDLNAELAKLPGSPQNRLGAILKDFLLAIRDMTHDDFLAEVKGIRFCELSASSRELSPSPEPPLLVREPSAPALTRELSEFSPPTNKRTFSQANDDEDA